MSEDVIELDKEINEPMILKVGELPKFHVQPGKKNKKMAVQVIETVIERRG